MRKSWLAAICVAAGAGAVGFHGAVWADDSLDATVRNFAINSVTRMMWLKQGDDYWAYYSIPPEPFAEFPMLGIQRTTFKYGRGLLDI